MKLICCNVVLCALRLIEAKTFIDAHTKLTNRDKEKKFQNSPATPTQSSTLEIEGGGTGEEKLDLSIYTQCVASHVRALTGISFHQPPK